MGFYNCSMFCCALLYASSSFAIILMGKRDLVALLSLSSWCLVIVVWLFLLVPWVCLQFVIVVFPDHTHLLFWTLVCNSPQTYDGRCYKVNFHYSAVTVVKVCSLVIGCATIYSCTHTCAFVHLFMRIY